MKRLFVIFLSICCLQLTFSGGLFASSKIPQSGNVSSQDLTFIDKTLEVVSDIVFIKARYFFASAALLASILTLKSLMVSIPLFVMALLLMFFPAINDGFWNLGSTKGILNRK